VRRNATAFDHALGDAAAHKRHRLDGIAVAVAERRRAYFACFGCGNLERFGWRGRLSCRGLSRCRLCRRCSRYRRRFCRWSRRATILDETQDVVFGDATADARAVDLRHIDVVFFGDLAHDWR